MMPLMYFHASATLHCCATDCVQMTLADSKPLVHHVIWPCLKVKVFIPVFRIATLECRAKSITLPPPVSLLELCVFYVSSLSCMILTYKELRVHAFGQFFVLLRSTVHMLHLLVTNTNCQSAEWHEISGRM